MSEQLNYLYLNQLDTWPSLQQRVGVVVDDGALRLGLLPGQPEQLGPALDNVAGLAGPLRIGVDRAGDLYIADCGRHRILKINGYHGCAVGLACLSGPGSEPGQLLDPRGVLVGPRDALYIADSGNHRVQVVDLRTGQLRGIWGQPDPWARPAPGDAPGRFRRPCDLVADSAHAIYVAECGEEDQNGNWHSGRIQKFDADGRVNPSFWQTMSQAARVPGAPCAIAVALVDDAEPAGERLLVIDRRSADVLVYDPNGQYDATLSGRWSKAFAQVQLPVGLCYSDGRLLIADGARQCVLAFGRAGEFIGMVRAYRGPIAGIALDSAGRLLIHPGGGCALTRLAAAGGSAESGSFLAGPFEVGDRPTEWHSVRVLADPLAEGAHVRFFTYTSDSDYRPALPDARSFSAEAARDGWLAAPPDALDLLIRNPPARFLWLAATLHGGGSASPVIRQIRLEYDQPGWLRHLPAIYSRDAAGSALLKRALALFESLLADQERLIDDLPLLFDPRAASDEGATGSWLDWLSGWLAFELDAAWDDASRRQALAGAFALLGRRGTVAGLRDFVRLYAGADARIEEPGRFAAAWCLGSTSTLGFDTMLVIDPHGAILDTSATLDQARLGDELAAGLFDDIVHHFCVQVYADQAARPGVIDRVRQVLEREKPAHTSYHLCVVEARMRVGFQARLGIDTIVAGPPPGLILGDERHLGADTGLPDTPDRPASAGTVGRNTTVQ